MAERLVSLKTLAVANCVPIEEILVTKKPGEDAISFEQTPFPKLESLMLSNFQPSKDFVQGK